MEGPNYQEKELFVAVFAFFKKNLLLLGVLMLIGGVLGYGYSKTGGASYYYATAVCSEIIDGELIGSSLLSLSDLVSSGNAKNVSKVLNISEEQARSIIAITYEIPEGLNQKKHILFGDNCIKATVVFNDSMHIQPAIKAVQTYISTIPSFKEIQKNLITTFEKKLAQMEKKTNELDQLHVQLLEAPKEIKLFDLGYIASLHFERDLSDLEKSMYLLSEVAFYSNDGSVIIAKRKKAFSNSLVGAAAFFFLGLSFLLLREINRLIE